MCLLVMETSKVFNELNGIATQGNNNIGDRLSVERAKAIEVLQKATGKAKCVSLSGVYCSHSNKENSIDNYCKKQKEKVDMMPYRCDSGSINISDLITDKTIQLEHTVDTNKSHRAESDLKRNESGILFEPEEITGRSTLCKGFARNRKVSPRRCSTTKASRDVEEVLSNSIIAEVRALVAKPKSDANALLTHTAGSSSMATALNSSRSLPCTENMSQVTEMSTFGNCGLLSLSNSTTNNNDSAFSSEEFAAVELMQSKLLQDEISWAKNYAVMPTAVDGNMDANEDEPNSSRVSSCLSLMAVNPNFSVGSYFHKRSEDIRDIVGVASPQRTRTLHALVEAADATGVDTTASTTRNDLERTPKADNRTYSLTMMREAHETEHSSRNSYLLSLTAIDRALHEMEITTDVSEDNIINKLKFKGKERNPHAHRTQTAAQPSREYTLQSAQQALSNLEANAQLLYENKENLDPQAMRSAAQLSDTLSFTESLLNCTDLKSTSQSKATDYPRSPLSPIDIKVIQSEEANNDGDIDEWSPPVKAPQQQKRRTKSPVPPQLSGNSNDGDRRSHLAAPCRKETSSSDPNITRNDSKTPSPDHRRSAANAQLHVQQRTARNGSNGISPLSADDAADRTLITSPSPQYVSKSASNTLTSTKLDHVDKPQHKSPHLTRDGTAMSGMASPCSSLRSPKLSPSGSNFRLLPNDGAIGGSSPVSNEASCTRFDDRCNSGSTGARDCRGCEVGPTRSSPRLFVNDGVVVRSTSRCSNSSEFSHRDGKILPLKVTHTELCWGSTKLRANSRKSLQVKNTSDKRLVLRMAISGPGFSLLNFQSSTLAFQSQECRTITVNFSPTIMGAAVGALSFFSPLSAGSGHVPYMELPLYGFGGNAIFQLQNIAKGPVGTPFLTMGEHLAELAHPLVRSIKIHNRGPLLGFALVTTDSCGPHMSRLCDAFEVKPQQMLIPPGDTATVSITFHPKRDDVRKIAKKIQAVYTLANMRVIVGDDANRQRMRRLVQRMSNRERAKLTSSTLESLWTPFPGERVLSELNLFTKEPTKVVSDLMTGVAVHEITLTLNHHESPDNTMDATASSAFCCFPDGDETVLFRTICVEPTSPTSSANHRSGVLSSKMYPVSEVHEATVSSTTTSQSHHDITEEGGWTVSPTELVCDLYGDRRPECMTLLVRNAFRSRQYFEVTCTHAHLLSFTPSEGYVQPDGGQVEIKVHAMPSRPPTNLQYNEAIFIEVSMENERIRVPVKLSG